MDIKSLQITSANTLRVTVWTTGLMGGDTGHGGRTVFQLTDEGGTDIRCYVRQAGEVTAFEELDSVAIVFGGDTELETFIMALEYAAAQLRASAGLSGPIGIREETISYDRDPDEELRWIGSDGR